MYDELIKRLRTDAVLVVFPLCDDLTEAADAIEELQKRVPKTPHGRLIDGDVAEAICFTNEDADGKDFYDGILFAADWIRKQSTIIEAEKGE